MIIISSIKAVLYTTYYTTTVDNLYKIKSILNNFLNNFLCDHNSLIITVTIYYNAIIIIIIIMGEREVDASIKKKKDNYVTKHYIITHLRNALILRLL